MDEIKKVEDDLVPFTNWSETEFVGKWSSNEYTFPPLSTVPLVGKIKKATPEDCLYIRRKFAIELAQLEFYKSEKWKTMQEQASLLKIQQSNIPLTPPLYSEKIIEPLVEKALTPLPIAVPTTKAITDDTAKKISRNSKVVRQDAEHTDDLMKEAAERSEKTLAN